MDIVNEKSTPTLTVDFFDENGAAVVPSSATYQIDDIASGTIVRAETALPSLAASVDILLATADTIIITSSLPGEDRLVTVKWQYGSGKQGAKEYRYLVKNLSKVS
jgi:hypothetical protein